MAAENEKDAELQKMALSLAAHSFSIFYQFFPRSWKLRNNNSPQLVVLSKDYPNTTQSGENEIFLALNYTWNLEKEFKTDFT